MLIPSRIYVAPTEPPIFNQLGTRTLLPETMGCDFLVYSYTPYTLIGFQRKELSDFIASLSDGRLTKELGQITDGSQLSFAVLIIEGMPVWTNDGKLAVSYGQGITRSGFYGLVATIQKMGIIVLQTLNSVDTLQMIKELSGYLSKPSHSTLNRRPKTATKNSWGNSTSESFASHLLQSFPGVGPDTARSIYKAFGRAPLSWICTEAELLRVPGIGKKLAQRLMDALHD